MTHCALSAPTLQQATADPHLHQRLLDTHGQVQDSLLWGHCSFLPGPGAQGFVCALQESVSKSWGSSGGSMVGLMVTSSGMLHPELLPLWQATADPYLYRDTQAVLAQSLSGLWVLVRTRFV